MLESTKPILNTREMRLFENSIVYLFTSEGFVQWQEASSPHEGTRFESLLVVVEPALRCLSIPWKRLVSWSGRGRRIRRSNQKYKSAPSNGFCFPTGMITGGESCSTMIAKFCPASASHDSTASIKLNTATTRRTRWPLLIFCKLPKENIIHLLFLQSHHTDNQHAIQPHTESRSLCYNLDTLISSQFHHFHSQSILNKPYKGKRFYPTLKLKSRTRDQTISQTKLERWW